MHARVLAPSAHPSHAGAPCAAQCLQQHRLGLVGAVMGQQHA
jgi:hypothetical protein